MAEQQKAIQLEKDLHRLISRKQAAEQHIATLEARLYDLETEYLRETMASHGSILKSLDGYHGLKANSGPLKTSLSGKKINEADRIFSKSSHTWRTSVKLYRAASGHPLDDDMDHINSGNDSTFLDDQDDDESFIEKKKSSVVDEEPYESGISSGASSNAISPKKKKSSSQKSSTLNNSSSLGQKRKRSRK